MYPYSVLYNEISAFIVCVCARRCAHRARESCVVPGPDRGRPGARHRLVGHGAQDLELTCSPCAPAPVRSWSRCTGSPGPVAGGRRSPSPSPSPLLASPQCLQQLQLLCPIDPNRAFFPHSRTRIDTKIYALVWSSYSTFTFTFASTLTITRHSLVG